MGSGNMNSHGTQTLGMWAAACFPRLPPLHRPPCFTLHTTEHAATCDVQKTRLFPRLQAFAKIVSSAENTPPRWPGKILKLPALHFSSGDEGSHYLWYQQKRRAVSRGPSRPSPNPAPHALLLVSLRSQNPLLLSIFTPAYETKLFLCLWIPLRRCQHASHPRLIIKIEVPNRGPCREPEGKSQ